MKRNVVLLALLVVMTISSTMTGCMSSCSRTELPESSMGDVLGSESSMPSVSVPPVISQPMDSSSSTAPEVSRPVMSADFEEIGTLSSEKIAWGWGYNMDPETNRSVSCMALQEQYGKYNADFIGENKKEIYLTFDEGYENGYTSKILDVLKEKDVKAVFFVTYHYCNTNPDLVQRMIDEGHVLGNHSYSHPDFNTLSPEEIFDDLKKMHDYVKETFDYDMYLMRCPAGEFNEQTLAVAQQMGYRTSFWSFAYSDWDANAQPDPTESLQKIQKYMHPGEIMLLHAVSSTNADILGDVIDYARGQGYEVLPYPGVEA